MSFDQGFKAKALAVLTLTLMFGSGFGIGIALDRNLIAGTPTAEETEPKTERAEERDRKRRPLIVEQVGLTIEQKAAVDETVREQRQRMKVIQEEFKGVEREFNERYGAAIRDTREAIKDHLTAEQRSQYDVLLTEHDERRRQKRERRNREHPIP